MKNWTQKTKFRVTGIVIGLLISLVLFSMSFFEFFISNNKFEKEKNKLNGEYNQMLSDEETLKGDIEKLQDPEYLARYAREKYLYSKDDELIIKIEE